MSLNADTLIDRIHLKQKIARWRAGAIVAITVALMIVTLDTTWEQRGSHIARITIEGVIMDDMKRDQLFKKVLEDEQAEAVIIRIDSPGGSVVGGEQLYKDVKRMSETKPTVVVMRSVAASAGYMAALPAERIFASKGTLTGSIGVIFQAAEITELAERLGIQPIVMKSAPNKAVPNPFEKVTPEAREVLKKVILSSFDMFVDMVAESRELSRARVLELADGRVYTGTQALEVGLIDAIGGEKEALEWLHTEKKVDNNLKVQDRKPKRDEPQNLAELLRQMAGDFTLFEEMRLDGLVSIWQAKPM